jgi:hypothetical protein
MKTTSRSQRRLTKLVLTLLLSLGAAVASKATIIMSYDAGTNGVPASAPNPTNVAGGSWILADASAGDPNVRSEGQSPDPLHPNLNAWRMLDGVTTAGRVIYFRAFPTDQQATNAIWCGWKASAYMRVIDPVAGNAGTISIYLQFGSTNAIMNRRYLTYADIDANGALYAAYSTTATTTITTNAADALAYHLYEIVYDSATRIASLRVDGQVISSNWPSLTVAASSHGCAWGSGSSAGRGDGYFNRVTVEVNDPSPTTVTVNPPDATNNVAESHTFVADFTGCATNLQWYHDGSPIPGANGRSYTITSIVTPDAGKYKMGISDPQTGTEVFTTEATLTVNADPIPPTVVSVVGRLSLREVMVKFSEGIDPTTALNPANYQVAGDALIVSNVTLKDLVTVLVQTSDQTANSIYDLILSGIKDQSGNTMLIVTQAFTAANLVPVAFYDAGTAGNPSVPPDPSLTNAGHWTFLRGTNELLSATAVSPDGATDLNAWNITDHTTQTGQSIDYRWAFPKESRDFARTNGWRFRVRARFVDDFNTTTALLMLYGDSSSRNYYIFFDVSGIDLDLNAALSGSITTNLTAFGVGAFDYHTHEIVFYPDTQQASYYFDGALISSGWSGTTPSTYIGPGFGAAASTGMGSMNYNQVQFDVNNATSPVIATNPVSLTNVPFGSKATFSGFASGFVGGYQWYKDGVPVAGATGNSYTIASATATNEGQYTLRAYNSFVEVESSAATLTVGPMASIANTNGNLVITFTGTLQAATNITDTFTDVTPAPASPLILTSPTGPSLFYRSRK